MVAESLGQAVLQLSVNEQQLIAGLEKAKQSAQSAGRAIEQAFAKVGQKTSGPNSLFGLDLKLNSLRTELQTVELGSKRFRELRREIELTQQKLDRFNGGGAGTQVAGAIGGGIAGLVGFGAVAGFLQQSVQGAVELESITKKLSNTLGNQGAAGALAFTRGLSDDLGISFKVLAGSFGSFTAAATAANVPLTTQKSLFGAVAKAGQALGLSNDEINGSLLALQQVASKGTVQMEELRGQLGERLPIALSATARGLGLTQQELIKLVESGKLTASEFFPALTKGLNELTANSGGPLTAAQQFAVLGNAWESLQASFGNNILPTITPLVKGLAEALEGIGVANDSGDLRRSFGLEFDESLQLVGTLQAIEKQYNVNRATSKNLLSDVIAGTGATVEQWRKLNQEGFLFAQIQQNIGTAAAAFRAKYPDRAAEENARAAAAQKVLDAEKKLTKELADRFLLQTREAIQLGAIKEQFNVAGKIKAVYEDSTRTFEQQTAAAERLTAESQKQAAIQASRNAQLQIEAEIYKELAKTSSGTGERPDAKNFKPTKEIEELLSRLVVAREETRKVLAEAGAEAARAIAQASDGLRGAQDAFQGFQQSNFNFLTDEFQKRLLEDARTTVGRGLSGGFLRPETPMIGRDQLFRAADFVKGFEAQRQAVTLAQDQLSELQKISKNTSTAGTLNVTVAPPAQLLNLLPE